MYSKSDDMVIEQKSNYFFNPSQRSSVSLDALIFPYGGKWVNAWEEGIFTCPAHTDCKAHTIHSCTLGTKT